MDAKQMNRSYRLLYDGPLIEMLIDGQRQLQEFVDEAKEARRRFMVRLDAQRQYDNFRCPCGCGANDFCEEERGRLWKKQQDDAIPF